MGWFLLEEQNLCCIAGWSPCSFGCLQDTVTVARSQVCSTNRVKREGGTLLAVQWWRIKLSPLASPTLLPLSAAPSLYLPGYKYNLAGHNKAWTSDFFTFVNKHFILCLSSLLSGYWQVGCDWYFYVLIEWDVCSLLGMAWTWLSSYEAYPVEYYILVTAESPYSHLLGVCSIRASCSSGKCCSVPERGKFVKWQNQPLLAGKWHWTLTALLYLVSHQAGVVLFIFFIRPQASSTRLFPEV